MTTKTPIERHFVLFWGCWRKSARVASVAAAGVAIHRRPSGHAGQAGEARWTGQLGLTINRRSQAASRVGSAQVAQLVEHATENRSVGGSIPPLGTIKVNHLANISHFKKPPCPHYVRINVVGLPARRRASPRDRRRYIQRVTICCV